MSILTSRYRHRKRFYICLWPRHRAIIETIKWSPIIFLLMKVVLTLNMSMIPTPDKLLHLSVTGGYVEKSSVVTSLVSRIKMKLGIRGFTKSSELGSTLGYSFRNYTWSGKEVSCRMKIFVGVLGQRINDLSVCGMLPKVRWKYTWTVRKLRLEWRKSVGVAGHRFLCLSAVRKSTQTVLVLYSTRTMNTAALGHWGIKLTISKVCLMVMNRIPFFLWVMNRQAVRLLIHSTWRDRVRRSSHLSVDF